MKNIISLFTVTFLLLVSQISISQSLFNVSSIDTKVYHEMIESFPHVDTASIAKNTIFLNLNVTVFNRIRDNKISDLELEIPFFNESSLNLHLRTFSSYENNLQIKRHTPFGEITENYTPSIQTYRVDNNDNIKGVFVFSNTGLKAVFTVNNHTYHISSFKNNSIYFISDINKSPVDFQFTCSHDDLDHIDSNINNHHRVSASGLGCVEIAIEIDFYTFQSFGTYQLAIDWSLEMISVVNELFQSELNIGIKSNTAQVWEIPDPYSNFIEDPQNMLFSIRDNWSNNSSFSGVQRDLVHLFSKRNNTGTGGIAFLNGLSSNWNGYGFSSGLTDVAEYIDLPIPYFFWNIYCLAHELGHNFGAKHTQWCGWDGGPIDNCSDYEEMLPGECANYTNNPTPEIGTIMSYCHTWNYNTGGGIIMNFHNLVKDAVITYVSNQNLDDCEADDELELSSESIINEIIIYPNPAKDYLKVHINTIFNEIVFFKLFNQLGKLILSKSISDDKTNIDISSLSPGLYSAHIINKEKIKTKNIIIQ